MPKKIDFKDGQKLNQGIITIEPCYPGYGITLGNSLRRVLLSSLPGAAVTGVKIKGANHEFMTLPHIKEDILEIILNLKLLRLKVFGDEEVKLELDVHGEKVIEASDITKNSQAEIVNQDLVLAHITDMAGSLHMEIFVNNGRGYRPVENIEDKKNEIGYIEIDSIFSPVLFVGIKVENVRVGKMTNWDKLVLDIFTDGTITFQQAFEQAVQILIDQFSSLIKKTKDEKPVIKTDKKKEEIKETIKADIEVSEDQEIEEKPKKKRGRPRKN